MKMKKFDMLPVIAALVIAILVLPTLALPLATAATPTTGYLANVVTIPEDNMKLNTGMMFLGLLPTDYTTTLNPPTWFTDSLCSSALTAPVTVSIEVSSEPVIYPVSTVVYYQHLANGAACVAHTFMAPFGGVNGGWQIGWDLLSQHKILATLNGVPTKPDYTLCEIVEKEKAKIPPQDSKTASKRQFPDEIIKTTMIDVTSNFVCKFRWIKPGVGDLDVYFVGPHVANFIADHMLIVTLGYKVGKMTVWASDLQDICILGWAMGLEGLGIQLFPPSTLSAGLYFNEYWSWPDPMGPFVSCDEAAAWQLAWIFGGWGWGTN
jgi:hypothetical protein